MTTLKRNILFFLMILIAVTAIMPSLPARAATGTVSVTLSSANVRVGDNFTVKVTYSGSAPVAYVGWNLHYDQSLVSSDSYAGVINFKEDFDTQDVKSVSETYTFTAKAVGTCSFSLTDAMAILVVKEGNEDFVSLTTGGASVKISDRGSSNANLSSLKLSTGSLSPTFSNDVLSYSVSVPNSVNSISISAVAADSKARVSVSGANEVPVGSSQRVVIVTAEDGTVKKYTVNISRAAAPKPSPTALPSMTPEVSPAGSPAPTAETADLPDDLEVMVGGVILSVADRPETVTLPDGFTETEYLYRDRPVWAAQSAENKLMILYLQDQADERSGFYVYDEAADEFSKYIVMYTRAAEYTLLQRPALTPVPDGYVEKTAVIGGDSVTVWVPEAMKYTAVEACEFYLVYAMSGDGFRGFYVYDVMEKTFQRFFPELGALTDNEADVKTKQPVSGTVDNPDPDGKEGEKTGVGTEIKAFFGRIFGREAGAVDWFLFGGLILMFVLIVALVIFIVYATQKHREEAQDQDFPLADSSEKKKVFKQANLYEWNEPETEIGEVTVSDPEPEKEPENVPETEIEPESEPEPDPFDFTIDDLTRAEKENDSASSQEEKAWSFDDDIGDDFFHDSDV